MAILGICRLCLKQAALQDSHFIPKGAYRLVRGEGKNPHPLIVQGGNAIQSSAQTRAHLLCSECEQRLQQNGENTFFRYCYRGPGKFRLLDVLRAQKPALENERFAIYALPETENRVVGQIGYLGVSVFWKAAAHVWKDRGHTIESISLGVPYLEQLRQFLAGTAPFPEHAALVIEVSDETNRLISVIGTPGTSKFATNHLHRIDVSGIRFDLFVGVRMPKHIKELCAFRAGAKRLVLAKKQETTMTNAYRELLIVLATRS